MALFSHHSFDQHEQIVFVHDKTCDLKAIIAIHNTRLGPAVGGCRMWPYANEEQALTDVLRLSRGMTYKNALAGLAFGGGKSVIIADPKTDKSEALFRAFGRALQALGGRYYCAEDVGICPEDLMIAQQETDYVTGLIGKSGDPSPFTALGTYLGIKAAVKHQMGLETVAGLTVAVQGLGHVGFHLCRYLHQAGAKLIICDLDSNQLAQAQAEFNARIVSPEAIYHQSTDIYAPCALGATLNDKSIAQLTASIVAGCANNQLAEPRHAELLKQRGILYVPDYVINAGGIINISFEHDYDIHHSKAKIGKISTTLQTIFEQADKTGKTTATIADEMAQAIIRQA